MAVDYAKQRVQFGRPIGSFQAIKHRCADMLVRVESARSAAMHAAEVATDGGDDLATAASVAKLFCSEAFMSAATDNAIDKASNAAHSAIDATARRAKMPVDRMAEIAHDVSDKAVSVGNRTTEWVSQRSEELSARPKKLIADTSSYVSANPLKSLGIAVLAALVVGRLMR
jgi:alkylation response protein AidB-like acyl-CoA dehydrogenase